MELYLGLDLGTTGMKAVLMDCDMNVHASAQVMSPMMQIGDWREFDAEDFCARVYGLIKKVLEGVDPEDVKAVSAASASGNTVFLDERNLSLYNAISWTDRRVKGQEEEYLPGFDLAGVYEKTGWPYIGMFPLTHIAWMKKERPDVFSATKVLCMTTEYLLFRLCGKWGIDSSSATTFYLQDQVKETYCTEYLNYFGIKKECLPPIYPPKTILGEIGKEAFELTGLKAGTKVVLGSFDHPACARGMGVLSENDLLLSCGTSWAGLFVSRRREKAIKAGLLVDPFLREEGLWACIFAMTQYGEKIDAAVRRFIDDSEERYALLELLAQKGRKTEKDVVCSLTDGKSCGRKWRGLEKEEIAYAIMASSCADAKKGIKRIEKFGFVPNKIYMAGGPARSDLWPQILADVMGKEVYCLHKQFGGAVGAAIMAAIGDGKYLDEKDFYKDKENRYTVYSPGGESK